MVTGYTSGAHGDEGTPPKKSIKERYNKPSEKKPYIMADIKPFEKEQYSHFWTDLKQITYSIQHELERQKQRRQERI